MKKGVSLIYIVGPYLNNLSSYESWWFYTFHLHFMEIHALPELDIQNKS